MKLEPVKAAAWKALPEEAKELILAGSQNKKAVPVNGVFFDHWGNQDKILLLFRPFSTLRRVHQIFQLLVERKLLEKDFDPIFLILPISLYLDIPSNSNLEKSGRQLSLKLIGNSHPQLAYKQKGLASHESV